MRELRIAWIRRYRDLQPIRVLTSFPTDWNLRHEIFQPVRELFLWKHASHHIGFTETWRQKIFAGRLVVERAIFVRQKKFLGRIADQFRERIVLGRAGVIEHQPEAKRSLIML